MADGGEGILQLLGVVGSEEEDISAVSMLGRESHQQLSLPKPLVSKRRAAPEVGLRTRFLRYP